MDEILKSANIPIEWWPYCKIIDGVIYTPTDEELLQNGFITQEEYTTRKMPVPTLEQRNRADIDYIGMMTGVL